MKLKLPELYKPAIKILSALTEEEHNNVRNALVATEASLKTKSLSKYAAQHIKGIVPGLDDIISMLIGMNAVRLEAEVSIEQFCQDVVSSLEGVIDFPNELSAINFRQRLESLLAAPSIELSSQANDVQHEYADLFHSARILTDLRPLFNSSGTEIVGTMIVHNLKISSFQHQEFKEAFFAMDDADLVALRKVLDRAELKTVALEQQINKLGLRYFDSKKEPSNA